MNKTANFTLGVALALLAQGSAALERVQASDAMLDCAAIANEQSAMTQLVEVGSDERSLGTAAAGAAANVGGQVAASQVAGSLFGAFGGLIAKAAGAVAQTGVETGMGPDETAKARAVTAGARAEYLDRLAQAKDCGAGGAGKALSAAEFQRVADAAPAGTVLVTPLSVAAVQAALQEPVTPLSTAGVLDGKLDLKGKKVFVNEFRVLFDVGGEVTANTRGGYLFGTDYGATSATVTYKVTQVDVAALQAITDRAFEDFKARMTAAGVALEYGAPEGGGVYDATEPPSTAQAPVYIDKSGGYTKRRLLVMAPTGMKLVSRGFAGIGAGNIGKRIEWGGKGMEGLSITQSVNIAALETSGSGSSILRRGSSADASSELTVGNSADDFVVQSYVGGGLVRMGAPVILEGQFANFRTVGGFDSDKDMTSQVIGRLQNVMGQGANKVKRVEKEVDLDATAMTRLSLQGLATVNQALAELMRQ